MQVLLRKSIDRLGDIGDVVTVKPGYARNYLLAQGLAVAVNDANIRRVQIEKEKAEETSRQLQSELTAMAENLKTVSITLSAKANEEGHLFGSISATHIAETLQAEGYKINEKMVVLPEHIKELGVIDVPIQLSPELVTSCKVWVVAE